MTPVSTTRRHAIIAVGMVWVLVCGGLAWATRSAIQLDRIEAREEDRRADEVRFERAVARIEAEIAPFIYTERARPYSLFRSFFITTEARYRGTSLDASRDVEVASPIKDFQGPPWFLLHFQVSETEGWSSPQLGIEAKYATPAGSIPPASRAVEATPENWLAALKERYTPDSLQQVIEEALMSSSQAADESGAISPPGEAVTLDESSVAASESARRAERLMQLQRQVYPESSCEPELVAMSNLETGAAPASLRAAESDACVGVLAPLMTPVWLDLTSDGTPQLAFVRAAYVETARHCTLQGFLIDWEQLKASLEAQIRDLFPNARLIPVRVDDRRADAMQRGMLQMIPARLVPGERAAATGDAMSASLVQGLAVAWGTTILALVAITYGVMKYLTLAERRMKFVAAVTHELRTPLTSFQLYSDLLGDMPEESADRRRQYAGILKNESSRLSRLVENVLAYSRVGDAMPRLRPRDVRTEELLDAARAATADVCVKAEKSLVVENLCPDTEVETDPEYVVQILSNLIENACKYSAGARDARIWLTARPGPGDGVMFEVDDAGPGVPARDRRAVFEPFRRGARQDDRRTGGVGLGLSLSRYWAQCLGGVLMLRRSERNGSHYSCFSLTIPSHNPVGEV